MKHLQANTTRKQVLYIRIQSLFFYFYWYPIKNHRNKLLFYLYQVRYDKENNVYLY